MQPVNSNVELCVQCVLCFFFGLGQIDGFEVEESLPGLQTGKEFWDDFWEILPMEESMVAVESML